MDEFEKQIEGYKQILWKQDEKDIWVNKENLEKYLKYLTDNVELPCLLTWRDDFDWEEKYVFWFWDSDEYEELKKTRASYTDTFSFIEFEPLDYENELFIKVRRKSDRRKFTIWLYWLKAIDKDSKNYAFIENYGTWHANYF
jgi:hypothetical protein